MKNIFRKLFNIYPGEEKSALLFAFLGFTWALAATSGLKFADALFLIHVGAASLPTTYILVSTCMILLAAFLLYAFHHFEAHHIFYTVLLAGIAFYALSYTGLALQLLTHHTWFWFALRIFGSIFFAVVVTCFWTFIDQYYHLQDAKRLYSLFSSMVFLGVATTGAIMHSGIIDFQHLCLVIIVFLAMAAYIIYRITHELQPVHDESDALTVKGQENYSIKQMIFSALKSKFSLLLMVGNFLGYLLLVITEFNYLAAFQENFDVTTTVEQGFEASAPLTQFIGKCLAAVSVSNLIFGLFFYSRCVRMFGIGSMLFISPIILIVTFSGWLLSDTTLIFAVMGYFVVEGTLYVIDDSNFTLLLNAVPSRLKYKIRIFIESFFEPIGMLISALLLSLSPTNSKLLGLVLAVAWLLVAFILRKLYPKAIYKNLSDNAIHFERTLNDWFSRMSKKERKASEHRLLAILRQGEESSQIFSVESLMKIQDPTILEKFLKEADHVPRVAKIKFIQTLADSPFATLASIYDHVQAWVRDDPDLTLRAEAHFLLATQGLLHPEKAFSDLKSSDLKLRASAIIALKKSWAHLPAEVAAENRTLAAQYLEELLTAEDEESVCMGLIVIGQEGSSHDVDIIMPYLKNASLLIARQAAKSLASLIDVQSRRYSQELLDLLGSSSDPDLRTEILKSLGKLKDSSLAKPILTSSVHFRPSERRLTESVIYEMGLRTVPILLAITKDTTQHDRCRVLAGKILGRLALPQLRANLYEIIKAEIERAYFYYFHYHYVQTHYPEKDLGILQDALLSGYHSVMDFMIQILGTAGEIEDCELLSRSIRSKQPKVRSQVVETLERTCEPKIYRLLHPLVSELPLEERMHAFFSGGRKPMSLPELLDWMSSSPALGDEIVAATFRCRLNLPGWKESLRKQMSGNEEIFHHFAYELLDT